jgi:hypothetical protein
VGVISEAVVQPHADVAGRGVHVAALEQRAADAADLLAQFEEGSSLTAGEGLG